MVKPSTPADRALAATPEAHAIRAQVATYLPLLKLQLMTRRASLPSYLGLVLDDLLAACDQWEADEHGA